MLNRKEAIKQAAEIARIEQNASLQQEIIFLVEEAWLEGTPLNKTSVTKQVKRKKSEVVAMLDSLLARGKFHEIPVPSQLRANNSKSCFLVSLTDEEQAVYVRNGTIPSAKKTIPPTWRKDHD